MADEPVVADEREFWERRHELSPSPIAEADVAQSGGQDRHLVLLTHLEDRDVVAASRPVLDRLGGFECVEPIPERSLHVTVKVFGTVVEQPSTEAEFSSQEERELATVLESVLAAWSPFDVAFPRFNLFPGVVYAEVADSGRFRAMNQAVCELPDVPVWDRDGAGFIPHLTLGQFTQRSGYGRLVEYLETHRQLDLPTIRIDQVKLVALDRSNGRFPPYEMIETYRFD